MIYSAVSCLKRELYEKTQYSIGRNKCKESEVICFTEKEISEAEWKEEKEFTFHGYSYDVIKVNMINGKKYYLCYIDKKDIIINSVLDFSKKLTVKRIHIRGQIDLPIHGKNIFKISDFFAVLVHKEIIFFDASYFKTNSGHYHYLKNTHYTSIIIPPPEPDSGIKRI